AESNLSIIPLPLGVIDHAARSLRWLREPVNDPWRPCHHPERPSRVPALHPQPDPPGRLPGRFEAGGPMRVLVTGGAGFIGSAFVRQTVRERPDVQVTVLDALTYAGDERSLDPVADAIVFAKGDIADPDLVDRLVAESDVVVHFA